MSTFTKILSKIWLIFGHFFLFPFPTPIFWEMCAQSLENQSCIFAVQQKFHAEEAGPFYIVAQDGYGYKINIIIALHQLFGQGYREGYVYNYII